MTSIYQFACHISSPGITPNLFRMLLHASTWFDMIWQDSILLFAKFNWETTLWPNNMLKHLGQICTKLSLEKHTDDCHHCQPALCQLGSKFALSTNEVHGAECRTRSLSQRKRQRKWQITRCAKMATPPRIHVWYIYLHLVDFYQRKFRWETSDVRTRSHE